MKDKRGFTLIEIMVVVAIIALLAVLTLPSIRAMQAGNARAQAFNTINAAFQSARSYAIMHNVPTAARFQPNGKIVLVYKYSDTLYLPVINREPLVLPRRYAAVSDTSEYYEPFYVCYNSDGTLAVDKKIDVSMWGEDGGTWKPINLTILGGGDAWASAEFLNSDTFSPEGWVSFLTTPSYINNQDNAMLARFYIRDVLPSEMTDEMADYYVGEDDGSGNYAKSALSVIHVFETPDDWNKLPIHSSDANVTTRSTVVDDLPQDHFETIHINQYTGRVIRPFE